MRWSTLVALVLLGLLGWGCGGQGDAPVERSARASVEEKPRKARPRERSGRTRSWRDGEPSERGRARERARRAERTERPAPPPPPRRSRPQPAADAAQVKPIKAVLRAAATGRDAAQCRTLVTERFLRQQRASGSGDPIAECERRRSRESPLSSFAIVRVTIRGATASAILRSGGARVRFLLARQRGRWRIDAVRPVAAAEQRRRIAPQDARRRAERRLARGLAAKFVASCQAGGATEALCRCLFGELRARRVLVDLVASGDPERRARVQAVTKQALASCGRGG